MFPTGTSFFFYINPMTNLDQPVGDPAWRFRGFRTDPETIDNQRDFLTVAASLAARSAHPGAPDLHRVALWNSRGAKDVAAFEEHGDAGFGGTLTLEEGGPGPALVGTAALFAARGWKVPDPLGRVAAEWAGEGAFVFFCGWGGAVRAALRFGG